MLRRPSGGGRGEAGGRRRGEEGGEAEEEPNRWRSSDGGCNQMAAAAGRGRKEGRRVGVSVHD